MLPRYRYTYGVRHAALYLRCIEGFGSNEAIAINDIDLCKKQVSQTIAPTPPINTYGVTRYRSYLRCFTFGRLQAWQLFCLHVGLIIAPSCQESAFAVGLNATI